MLPEKRIPTHPGEILLVEFLNPMGMTQVDFSMHLKIPIQRVNEIIKGKRAVTPETAWLFSRALGTSPEFWLNLQAAHDLGRTLPKKLGTITVLRPDPEPSPSGRIGRRGRRR
jgi:addiction module HigA family antidote